jgi:hypothetical protein
MKKVIRLTESDLIKLVEKVVNEDVSEESRILDSKKKELSDMERQYGDAFNKMNSLHNEIQQLENRISPNIYFTTAKHHTTKEPYIIARSMYKKGTNDYVQLSAYIGPVSKFLNGVEDEQVKQIALDKIRAQIRKKVPHS